MRTWIFAALVTASMIWAFPAESLAGHGDELFSIIVAQTEPQKAVMRLEAEPTDDGFVKWGYLECDGAKFRGMHIQKVRIDCFDAKITPPDKWKDVRRPKIESMMACHAEGIFTEKDVNDFLKRRLFGKHKEWSDISVKMTDGRISATGYYIADLKLFRLKIRVDISCGIVGRGHGLWLDDVELRLNTRRVTPSLVRAAIDRLQPFVDMDRFNLPLSLRKIEFSDGACRVSSAILPKSPTKGPKWEYSK